MTTDYDRNVMGNATKLARTIFSTPPMTDYAVLEVVPSFAVVPPNATDEQWQAYVNAAYVQVTHPIGSVPMLPKNQGGAVDSNLLVYGTVNVRVVGKCRFENGGGILIDSVTLDSSIMPIQISAHLSATVYGIAEKVS
jgi:choline dehydrogenase-like flavoprotein